MDVGALRAAMELGGTQTINLAQGGEYVLLDGPYNLFSLTGLPIIRTGSNITIHGNGATIRANSVGFRIFGVDQGTLTLKDLTLRDATLFSNGGAAISNSGGILTLENVRMENNRVESDTAYGAGTGGAVYTFFGRTTITDSAFINNYAINYGGGLYGWDSAITITGTRFEGNQAGRFGGAIGTRDERSDTTISGEENIYSGNSALQGGGAFYVESGGLTESNSLIANNNGGVQGGLLFSGASGELTFVNPSSIQVTQNDITGNSSPLVVSQGVGSTVNLDQNWWGTPSGPAPTDLIGSGISATNPIAGPTVQCYISVTDSDGDCLPDTFEQSIPGLSSTNPDSDGNGTRDDDEDADSDGLTNVEEFIQRTSATIFDTDEDGLGDGAEIYTYFTDPTDHDSDGDELVDGFEVIATETNPNLADSDTNGITDSDEDFDGDGLTHLQEQRVGTNPRASDTNDNGIEDGNEDFDGDGLTNLQELLLVDELGVRLYDFTVADSDGNTVLDGDEDPDDDDLLNRAEYSANANPLVSDTDSDRLPDGFEVNRSQTHPVLADTDGNSLTDDREDPDADALTNYQEFRLGTDPRTFTTLGAPSRLRSETVLMPTRTTADGSAAITMMTVIRDAQGRFLPARAVTWTSSNPNIVFSSPSSVTDDEGVATVQVTSGAVTSGVVEIRALGVVVGRPLVQFIGGDPAVRFTSTSYTTLQPGQVVNATFEVVNGGVLPISDIEVVANLPFGLGVVEAVSAEGDVELVGQGSNAATWNIPRLMVNERRIFSIRYRSASTLRLNNVIPLTVQTSSIDDTNVANNSATFSASIVQGFNFPSSDQQPDKLSVVVSAEPAFGAIGETIELVITVENLSAEPLYNLSGFAPLLGIQYPNVAFRWNTPAQPGTLAPAGSGDTSRAVARIPFTIPENYPTGLNRVVAVQAIDDDPSNGSLVVVRDSLENAELGIRGPNLQTSLTANSTTAVAGDIVTFTLTVSNSTTATDTATNLQIAGTFITDTQTLSPLPPGGIISLQFTRPVTLDDVPQISAQILLTGQGETQTDVRINRTLRAAVSVIRPVVPNSANLLLVSTPTLTFLPGRMTPLPLTVRNNGEQNADDVRLMISVPFGLEPDMTSLGSGTYDTTTRVITWQLGTLAPNPNSQQPFTPTFITPSDAEVGTLFVLDAVLTTTSDEISLDDNVISASGLVALPAPARVNVNPSPRNWLVGDDSDQLTLTVTVFDQLGAPLAGVTPIYSSSLPGVSFINIPNVPEETDSSGVVTIGVRATQAGVVSVIASFPNGVSGSTVINRRASAVEITRNPVSIGIGGTDRYNLFVVNTATLPDGTTSTSDLVDLDIVGLPPSIQREWFTFVQPTLPLGFGDFAETGFTVSIPPALALPDCQALVGTYPFTVTATGRTLGIVGQAQGLLTIVAQPPELTNIVPNSDGRVGGTRVLFGWRSNTPGTSRVYYRRQGETSYTTLSLTADTRDPRLYSASIDVQGDAEGTVFEWYGTIDNGCSTRSFGSEAFPQTFTRVRSTTFVDTGYNFTVADGYDLMTTVSGGAMSIRVRNDDDQARAIVLDVENPYDDLILGFTGSGSVDQVLLLQPGDTFEAPLRIFTQATERAVYTLAIRLENDRGDVDRIPLVIEVRQPNLALDIQVLAVDPRTLVTTARLTNLGDTLTDLALNIVQDSTGIPANFVIQPDIQHTYLLAGQSLDIALIPLDLNDSSASAPANMSVAQFDPLTSTPLNAAPSLAAIAGPYRITASARRMTLPNVTLRDGTITNTCGAGGSVQTIAADCTTPAGSETRVVNDWYCTNKPNIDVPISLALPNGGRNVPITSVSVAANFSPGGGAYTHSTTVSLNGSLVGSAIVPSQSIIQGNVASQSLFLGGNSPTQILNLRSTHTNGTHYTVASGFSVTVDYDEHTRTGCFTQAEIDAATGEGLMCTPSSVLVVPEQELELTLLPTADDETLPQDADGTYLATQGQSFTLNAEVTAAGTANIIDPVQIKLIVPRGIVPQGMTIQGEDPVTLSDLISVLTCLLRGGSNCGDPLNDVLGVILDQQAVTYTYTTETPVVIGQPFPIRLNVVGDRAGTFTIEGTVSTGLTLSNQANLSTQSFTALTAATMSTAQASLTLQVSQTASEQEYFAQFRGIIFWTIYNETNANQQIPLYEALPGTATSIPNSITDRDHRYLVARTILNNVPLDDVSAGLAYMRRWGGSIANTGYDLWSYQQGQAACDFKGEPVALSYAIAAGDSDTAILRWFNGYMECLRTGQPLENKLSDYDEAYGDITGFIDAAIADHVNESANPVVGAQFVKHTSSCFVWQRDTSGRITSCHGDGARINMQSFCAQPPYMTPPTDPAIPTPAPIPNRNCQVTSTNPSSVVVADWLASPDGQISNQQLGLETVVGRRDLINLGLYTDNQPYSCGFLRCYFLLGNPTGRGPNEDRREDISETRTVAWARHEAAQINPDYGYRGFAQSYLVHVLWIDDNGNETWVTTVFQQ